MLVLTDNTKMKSQPRNEKYANESVGAMVILIARVDCLSVIGFNRM